MRHNYPRVVRRRGLFGFRCEVRIRTAEHEMFLYPSRRASAWLQAHHPHGYSR